MLTYIIGFQKDKDATVAYDAFQGLRSDYGFDNDHGDDWFANDLGTEIKQKGAYLYLRGNQAKVLSNFVKSAYEDYEPYVDEIDKVEESYKPTDPAAAFRAMRKGKLAEYKLNEDH